jgi:hypothetical protein
MVVDQGGMEEKHYRYQTEKMTTDAFRKRGMMVRDGEAAGPRVPKAVEAVENWCSGARVDPEVQAPLNSKSFPHKHFFPFVCCCPAVISKWDATSPMLDYSAESTRKSRPCLWASIVFFEGKSCIGTSGTHRRKCTTLYVRRIAGPSSPVLYRLACSSVACTPYCLVMQTLPAFCCCYCRSFVCFVVILES